MLHYTKVHNRDNSKEYVEFTKEQLEKSIFEANFDRTVYEEGSKGWHYLTGQIELLEIIKKSFN